MKPVSTLLVAFVALEHLGFLVLEMFLWTSPTGLRVFGMTAEQAASAAVLAANQGLYNGFLAAGLFWGLISGQRAVKVFFLTCVVVAGIVGAYTAKSSILFVQGLPAAVGLCLVLLTGKEG
jgi:putative membrane protein